MRKPAYSTVVKALGVMIDLASEYHSGNPPSWSPNCPKCGLVNEAKTVLEQAKQKLKKRRAYVASLTKMTRRHR